MVILFSPIQSIPDDNLAEGSKIYMIYMSLLNGKVGYMHVNTTHYPFMTGEHIKTRSVLSFQKFLF